MLNVNSYFEGKVKSIAFKNSQDPATVGVMQAGDYVFGTQKPEVMTVISGALTVLLPGSSEWKVYSDGESFEVAANQEFKLKVAVETAYLCIYKD